MLEKLRAALGPLVGHVKRVTQTTANMARTQIITHTALLPFRRPTTVK